MSSNFDFLKGIYEEFANQAIEAENSLIVSPSTCAILSRRALELAVRFVFIKFLLYQRIIIFILYGRINDPHRGAPAA